MQYYILSGLLELPVVDAPPNGSTLGQKRIAFGCAFDERVRVHSHIYKLPLYSNQTLYFD
jgi:hypothetical protein